MRLPRLFVATLLTTGCSSPSNNDAGSNDAGANDGGNTDPCVKGMSCDAGNGLVAQCIELNEPDGGTRLSCEAFI